jgi:hypothetical protein
MVSMSNNPLPIPPARQFPGTAYKIFSGKNLTGGNASTVIVQVPNLFNSTNARFTGVGAFRDATTYGVGNGGNGGTLRLLYRGLIGDIDVLRIVNNAVHPDFGPDWSIRYQLQFLFPK